jgi:hypothetical protein
MINSIKINYLIYKFLLKNIINTLTKFNKSNNNNNHNHKIILKQENQKYSECIIFFFVIKIIFKKCLLFINNCIIRNLKIYRKNPKKNRLKKVIKK